MDILKYFLLSIIAVLSLTSCQAGYYFTSAYNQVSMMSHRVPLKEALQDPTLTEAQKKKLILAQEVREFAEKDLHLKNTDNYTSFVKLDRPYVTYVVSASPKWELKHHLWKYPFVGQMPYKGFFDEGSAKEEETDLKKEDLDTYVRGVSAYSTLGWFQDPILSSMLNYTEYELVNTLIHETVHTTIFIKNSADFNERLAVFLGNKGMELFYLKKEGPQSETLKRIRIENEDDKIFSAFISKEITQLGDWYKNQKVKDEGTRQKRIREIQDRFANEVEPQMKGTAYAKFKSIRLNNARLMLYKTYMQDLTDFEKLYDLTGQDFSKFLNICRNLEAHPKPEVGLKDLIIALQSPSGEPLVLKTASPAPPREL